MLRKIHHVGIVVHSIDAAYAFYRDTLSLPVHKEDIIQDQGVKAALLTVRGAKLNNRPGDLHTGVARFLARQGEGYHLCFETDDVAGELEAAETKCADGAASAWQPMVCFLHPKASHGVLIEYAQP
jgi:methylmalonyl-CoA/ethylmalonyl-CoA epimerase